MTQNEDHKCQEEILGTDMSLGGSGFSAAPKPVRKSANKSDGFIRQKIIKGRPYYYHVRTVRVNGKPRQKVVKYLGTTLPKGLHLGPVERKE